MYDVRRNLLSSVARLNLFICSSVLPNVDWNWNSYRNFEGGEHHNDRYSCVNDRNRYCSGELGVSRELNHACLRQTDVWSQTEPIWH